MAGMRAASPNVSRKVVAVLLIVVGGVLVAVTLANNLFKVGRAFESMMGDFRPVVTQQATTQARVDLAKLGAVGAEFQNKVGPALAEQLKMTPDQFSAFVGQQFPATVNGMQALPQIVPSFNRLITTLDEQRSLFDSADAIPTKNLPATTVPWSLLAAGLLAALAGVLVWLTPRAGAVLAIALGLLLAIGPFLLTLPGKSADADQLNENLEPVYTQAMVDQGKGALVTLGAMGTEMQTKMLPALATQLKMSQPQLIAYMAKSFPATTAALATMPVSMARFQNMITVFDNNLGNYDTLKPVKFVPIIWTMIFSGIAVFLLGVWAIFAGRRPLAITVPDVPSERYPGQDRAPTGV